jgi:phosphopantothenoylcysteine decarboxylase / phosphopantothenate---cysteine ligase
MTSEGPTSAAEGAREAALSGKRVVLGITGGIAAYKAAELCRLLIKAGATVRVVMTEAATRFIAPLTLQTLSGAAVALDIFDPDEARDQSIGHIRLADEAEVIVVAPATADAIARMAAGQAGDLLTAVLLASRAPVLLAPAMNVNMWENPLTQGNLARLLGEGGGGRFHTVGPDRGLLACGWVGAGRLIEPAEIVAAAAGLLRAPDLLGLRVLVTAGPTHEPVDDVRYLGNRSSGKMGFAIAAEAASRGALVTLLAGPATPATPAGVERRIDFETAADLERALGAEAAAADVVVMAAAVADFRPAARVSGKLSRRDLAGATAAVELVATPDLLARLGQAEGARPFLVGFAAETAAGAALIERASAKLREKGCDAVVANDVGAPGIGFGADDNAVTLVFADGSRVELARAPKRAIAAALWSALGPRLAERHTDEARGAASVHLLSRVPRGSRGKNR